MLKIDTKKPFFSPHTKSKKKHYTYKKFCLNFSPVLKESCDVVCDREERRPHDEDPRRLVLGVAAAAQQRGSETETQSDKKGSDYY